MASSFSAKTGSRTHRRFLNAPSASFAAKNPSRSPRRRCPKSRKNLSRLHAALAFLSGQRGASDNASVSTKTEFGTGSRRLQYTEGGSQKFWEITVDGPTFIVRFGRLGTSGQSQQKHFATESEALTAAQQLAQSKLRKGYVDQSGDDMR